MSSHVQGIFRAADCQVDSSKTYARATETAAFLGEGETLKASLYVAAWHLSTLTVCRICTVLQNLSVP